MPHRSALEGHRVLALAPFGRDAENLVDLLTQDGYDAVALPSLQALAASLDEHIGTILITEEALLFDNSDLQGALIQQPPWSDLPIVLLAARPVSGKRARNDARLRLGPHATNVIVLERPLSSISILSAVESALKSRQKQFEMRDRLADLSASQVELRQSRDLLAHESRALEILNKTGARVAAELDLDALVQIVVDAGVELTNAEFGAFFYNVVADEGESYMLYALSGVPHAAFEKFPMPRNTKVFAPTFHGKGVVRSADITQDPRYGQNPPYTGMPDGHSPVRSYLATPITSRSGEVLGGLFFGHETAGVFGEREERLMVGLASQAAIGIDNARLFQSAQRANRDLELRVAERTAALHLEMQTRARTEEALRQSQKMESVGQLTGGIAHDFNNMLTGIMGAVNIIRRRIATGRLGDLDRFMDAALDSAQRAANLTQRLLAFSRRQSLDSRTIDINALIESMDDLVRRSLRENIRLEIDLDEALPLGVADHNQLESAILNLAINARDAMPDGGTLRIETSLATPDSPKSEPASEAMQYVAIRVTDTGAGMSKEVQDRAFEPFFTTKPIGQGTGLGLSMVYGFVKQSRGHVRVHSELGSGTTITLFLPVSEGPVTATTPVAEAMMPRAGADQHVLVVEDDPAVRLLVREILSDLGYGAVETAEPQSAVRILASDRPIDLMVSDVGLPGMNGRQLAEIARQHRPELPILFITGYAENAAIRSSFVGTNMAMVMKPFALETLASKISEMLGSSAR